MKKVKMSIKDKVIKNIVSKSTKAAEENVNSACVWWINQPKPPKAAKELRKF